VWALTGEREEEPGPGEQEGGQAATFPTQPQSSEEKQLGGDEEAAEEDESRDVQRAVRRYVTAIDSRDGALLCGLVDGIADLNLPVRRSSCAESVSESIGYRDPRGIPVFESATVTGAPEVELGEDSARATATVITEFADRDEPSVEDDVVYLVRRGGVWVIAKPSSTLYRAIGVSDVPPDVLEPPA
jgi:hypothetical protein